MSSIKFCLICYENRTVFYLVVSLVNCHLPNLVTEPQDVPVVFTWTAFITTDNLEGLNRPLVGWSKPTINEVMNS